jgi:D-aspartate ligase
MKSNNHKINPKLTILILDQGRQSLPFFKSLSKAGHDIICICNSKLNETYLSRYPKKRLLWPSYVNERELFERTLLQYLRNNKVDVTISVGDISSDVLSKNKDEIMKYTRLTVPDYLTFLNAADKYRLMQYCMLNKLPCPITYELNTTIKNKINELFEFPVIVKPTRGVGAVGLAKYDNIEQFQKLIARQEEKFGQLIVQEFIPQKGGMQYQAEAFLDEKGMMKVCMVIKKPRFFPINGGTSTANVTIESPEIVNITKTLLEGLNWRGAADVDYILDPRDNIIKILEINPRVTAGIKIGFIAGIDFADLHLKLALGQNIPEIPDYKIGVYCRNFFLELLWLFYSNKEMKRNINPPFFKFPSKYVIDQVFSLDDPLTGFGFLLNMIRKYSNFSKIKSKFNN